MFRADERVRVAFFRAGGLLCSGSNVMGACGTAGTATLLGGVKVSMAVDVVTGVLVECGVAVKVVGLSSFVT